MAIEAAEKCALIVVDMQNDYCHARGVYPRNALNCFDLQSVTTATAAAVTVCKRRGIPVIYLRMAWNTDASGFPIDAGLIVEQSRPFIRTEGLRRGSWGVEMLEELPPPDYVIDKTRYSGFHNTGLEALLRGLQVETIYLTGVITNMCVEATARDAFHRDFRFVVLSDCVSAFSRKLHDASLETLQIFGKVKRSGELLGELQNSS